MKILELQRVWNEKFVPAIGYMTDEEPLKNELEIKNMLWHRENTETINSLENSRWNTADLLGKCDLIKEILLIRKDVITAALEQ